MLELRERLFLQEARAGVRRLLGALRRGEGLGEGVPEAHKDDRRRAGC